jgi:beta-glucosidase
MAYRFPSDFVWGTATAAYQVEGAVAEDGRVPSIWDTFAAVPGTISDASSGEVACDQYHCYPQDIALMKELGVGAYRLSIAWPRIVSSVSPDGKCRVNHKGIDHYKRVLDALREAGIDPVVTLYHWDLPQYLQDEGGWVNRDTAYRFAQYAQILAEQLGNRVGTWSTLNEPWCVAYYGYGKGRHAPGHHSHPEALRAVHHLNLAHGLALQAIRGVLGSEVDTSVTLNLKVNRAASELPEDVAAKRQLDRIANDAWLGPMLEGRYDPQIFADTAHVSDWSFVRDGDLDIAHQPLGSLGINYYSTDYVRRRSSGAAALIEREQRTGVWEGANVGGENIEVLPPAGPLTDTGWNQEPQGLTDILMELSRRYPDLPLIVTENGSAWNDVVAADGTVHDPQRVAYLAAHIEALAAALEQGANITGYFAWSLLDNFEWMSGYTKRFGLFRVDYATQERIWKDSARWYQQLATSGVLSR